MCNITLESLIQEHKERIKILRYHREAFIPYYDYENMEAYHLWVEKTKRYIRQNFSNDPAIKEFETLSSKEVEPEQQRRLGAIIEAFSIIPASELQERTKPSKKEVGKGVNITINNTNKVCINGKAIERQSFSFAKISECLYVLYRSSASLSSPPCHIGPTA